MLQWSSDEVDKREYASKKANLAAAELAKLSRRVYGNVRESLLSVILSSHTYYICYLANVDNIKYKLFIKPPWSHPCNLVRPMYVHCHYILL